MYHPPFLTVSTYTSLFPSRSLFRRIQRSFDPPNTSKRRRMSKKRAVGSPPVGPPALLGPGHSTAATLSQRGAAMPDPHGRAPLIGGSGVGHPPALRSFKLL